MCEVIKKRNDKAKSLENAHVAELVKKAQGGDDAAFSEIVKIFQPRIFFIIKRYIHQQAEVSDVSQEVFLKVHRYINSFKGDSSFYTWLYSVTTSVAKNYLATLKKSSLLTSYENSYTDFIDYAVDKDNNVNPQDILVLDETENMLLETFEKLPDILRDVIMLREIEGLSYVRIADLLDIPEGTVRSRIHRARSIIEDSLK